MSNLSNNCQFIGRLGKDPEIVNTTTGKKKASFSIATSKSYKKDGKKVEITQWHNIVAWGKLAEIIEKHLKKGAEVTVAAEHVTDAYEKEGEKKYNSYFLASEIRFHGSKSGSSTSEEAGIIEAKGDEADDLPF